MKIIDMSRYKVNANPAGSTFIKGFVANVSGSYKLIDHIGNETTTYLLQGHQYEIPFLVNITESDGSKVTAGDITIWT